MGVYKNSHLPVVIEDRVIATSGTAILAMRGGGKSWLNALLAEGLCEARVPFVIVDPEGEYWTLKISFPNVVVAGGEHADLPLEAGIGKELADCLVEERLELVLDMSDLKRSEQMMLVANFLEELFVKETRERIPLWVSFEEADIWVPQSGATLCKGRVLDVCQRGRKRGLGFSLVTQRPAIIDKTALSQTEIRFFKRFQQPQDLSTVKDYLGEHAGEVKALPSLRSNEALLYAPTLFDKPESILVEARKTPHGGATPGQVAELKPTTKILKLAERLNYILGKKKQEMDMLKTLECQVEKLQHEIDLKNKEIEKLRTAEEVAKLLAPGVQSLRSIDARESMNSEYAGDPKSESHSESIDTSRIPAMIQIKVEDELLERVRTHGVDTRTGLIVGDDFADLLLNRLTPDQRRIFLTVKRSGRPLNVSEIGSKTGIGEGKLRDILRKLREMKAISIVKRAGRGKNYAVSI